MGRSSWEAVLIMDKAGGIQGRSVCPGEYARVERERLFLLAEPPTQSTVTVARVITDRYLVGTRRVRGAWHAMRERPPSRSAGCRRPWPCDHGPVE